MNINKDKDQKIIQVFQTNVSHGATGGRKNSLASSVFVVNNNKYVGLGYAKSTGRLPDAINASVRNANNKMEDFSSLIDENKSQFITIPYEIHFKLRNNFFYFKRKKSGTGINAHFVIKNLFSSLGFTDFSCKIYGNRHLRTISFGALKALREFKTLNQHFLNIELYKKNK